MNVRNAGVTTSVGTRFPVGRGGDAFLQVLKRLLLHEQDITASFLTCTQLVKPTNDLLPTLGVVDLQAL